MDLVKIDVEGAELNVIAGGRMFFSKHRPRLLVEVHGAKNLNDCIKLLKEYGYKTRTVHRTLGRAWLVAEHIADCNL